MAHLQSMNAVSGRAEQMSPEESDQGSVIAAPVYQALSLQLILTSFWYFYPMRSVPDISIPCHTPNISSILPLHWSVHPQFLQLKRF